MSLEQVKVFYQRLASDEVFRSQIQSVKSKEECSQIVKTAGFNFTQQEFEEYTSQLLESDNLNEEVKDLSEKELASVAGGFINWPTLRLMYGLPPNRNLLRPADEIVRPMYGLPRPRILE